MENDVRVTDAKEVGVGNPAEETFCHPDVRIMEKRGEAVKWGPLLRICRSGLVWSVR
jgi:hypothetical protein